MQKRISHRFHLLVILLMMSGIVCSQTYLKKTQVKYTHAALVSAGDSLLYVRNSTGYTSACGFTIKKAVISAYFYLGDTYKFADTTLSGSVDVKIQGYNTYTGTTGLVNIYSATLKIDQGTPERLYINDFTSLHSQINRFVISVSGYSITSSKYIRDSVRLVVNYQEEFGVDVKGVQIANSSTTIGNPTTFAWTKGSGTARCVDVSNYQFQLLRLFNTDTTKKTEADIQATVDWNQALSIETGSYDTSITLPVAEGEGYYIWRVRPLGNLYSGGIADSRNWGKWSSSTYSSGSSYNITAGNNAEKFFFEKLSKGYNWIYSRTFSEGDPAASKVRMSEKMTYANGLQQVKQNQAHLQTERNILINQTVYDYSGRPAFTTLAAPVSIDTFGYNPGFIKTAGSLYTALNFDENTNFSQPDSITSGPLVDYYSNTNSDVYVPNAEGFPYSRALYERDATGRVREQGGPGQTHRIKRANDHTTRTYYSGVSNTELIRIFGDEAPDESSVHKMLAVDANKTATVSYIDKEGKTIATCLSMGTDNTILDTLSSQGTSRFTVIDTLRKTTPFGPYGTTAATRFAFAVPTTVTIKYVIPKKQIKELCTNYCSTCDYTVQFLIRADDTTYVTNKLISAKSCSTNTRWDTTFARTLNPGSYIFEKRVFANNIDPLSGTDSTGKATFLSGHLTNLKKAYEDSVNNRLSTVYNYLKTSNMSGLYTYLGVTTSVTNPDSVFADSSKTFNIGCSTIKIPIIVCDKYDCHDSTPEFEKYLKDRWKSKYPSYTLADYFAGTDYDNAGTFDTLVANMISYTDTFNIKPYNCNKLWDCWDRVVQGFDMKKQLSDSMAQQGITYTVDLVNEFLECAGRRFKGISNNKFGTKSYVRHAYKYFNYVWGNKKQCDTIACPPNGTNCSTTWTADSSRSMINNKWEKLYRCVTNIQTGQTANVTNTLGATTCNCHDVCESRYDDFVSGLIRMYHNDSLYVEGDKYALGKDTTFDQKYSFRTDTLGAGVTYIPMRKIQCAARSLVENCQKGCSLTIYKTGNRVDSIGSPAERLAMQKSMTWSYVLSRPSCGTGYTKIGPVSSADTNVIKLWDKHYGSNVQDELWDITEAKMGCGGYLLGGWTEASQNNDVTETNNGNRDYWLMRVNDNGDRMWDNSIGGNSYDELKSVIETSDGGFLLGGYSKSGISGDKSDSARWGSYDYWVVRINSDGKTLWNKRFGGSGDDRLQSVFETSDNKFILAGYSNSTNNGDKSQASKAGTYDYWVIKINKNGTKVWDKDFGTPDVDKAYTAIRDADGNYIVGGSSNGTSGAGSDRTQGNQGGAKNDYWIVKMDTAGTKLWDKRYGGSLNDNMTSMIQSNDRDLVLAGSSESANNGNKSQNTYGVFDYWVLKVNDRDWQSSSDTVRWDKTYGGTLMEGPDTSRYVRVKQLKDHGYLVGGGSKSNATGVKRENNVDNSTETYDYWVMRTDSAGTKKWDKRWGGMKDDYFTALDQDQKGYYWIAGYSYSDTSATGTKSVRNFQTPPITTSDYWVIKARDWCTHDTVCFKWVNSVIVPDSATFTFTNISCDSMAANSVYNSIQTQIGYYIQRQLDAFKIKYSLTCASPDSIKDTCSVTYRLGYHQYTLYYYDRGGNLVRTVAPKGPDLSSTTRSVHPSHTYVTKYKYNSLKQLAQQETPDGGITQFWYDYKGELRVSQNAKQKAINKYSYTMYDNLGRITQVGESSDSISTFFKTYNLNNPNFPVNNKSQRTFTIYTLQASGTYYLGMKKQRFLQNRVSYTYTDDNVFTYYSYDPHGNVEWLIQDIPGISKNYVRYEYDLVSNKVLAVHYNEGAIDQYHHKYTYDADQRILSAATSWTDGIVETGTGSLMASATAQTNRGWDRDATYTYYKHGPLKRAAIGEDHIQGMDYVYTLQGWLKAINHPSLDANDDPGADNDLNFCRDAFGMALGYHNNDFNRTSSKFNPSNSKLVSSQSGITDLYNGNISNWTLQSDTISGNYTKIMGFKYRYDQLNRIKREDYSVYGGSWSNPNDYDNNFIYDANGNILTLNRHGYAAVNTNMDSLTYNYVANTNNKLDHVDDIVAAGNYAVDIDDQVASNYRYDLIGNMISDSLATISNIDWTVYGKVKSVKKANGDSLIFIYDASGNRIEKINKPNGGAITITYFIRDASGNILSLYSRVASGSNYVYTQTEVPMYGSSRLGISRKNQFVKALPTSGATPFSCIGCTTYSYYASIYSLGGLYGRDINKKEYELTDHLGNVHVTVSDRKYYTNSTKQTAQIISYNNFFAFGSEIPGLTYNASSVSVGFNGKLKENDMYGSDGTCYDYGFRIYNPRIARFLSIDPLFKSYPFYSPYQFAGNKPIIAVDVDGKEEFLQIDAEVIHGNTTDINKVTYFDVTAKEREAIATAFGLTKEQMSTIPTQGSVGVKIETNSGVGFISKNVIYAGGTVEGEKSNGPSAFENFFRPGPIENDTWDGPDGFNKAMAVTDAAGENISTSSPLFGPLAEVPEVLGAGLSLLSDVGNTMADIEQKGVKQGLKNLSIRVAATFVTKLTDKISSGSESTKGVDQALKGTLGYTGGKVKDALIKKSNDEYYKKLEKK